ncbi:SH3 domain-containing protein [Pelagibacteraceae bacterium]|jgi:SH3-like domain-containing protein|nr:SH3 domain-containing protein [Pelagibacteraceae bacterium]|tara:strand:+ start:1215 stop:1661 length:447 start_codon:yes stop_codon:yes gene_type:complete
MNKFIFLSILFFFILTNLSFSDEYYSTLKYNKVNLRQGPSKNYPIKIFYKKKYLPVLVFDSSDNYRKIRDHENNTGWIHVSQLSKKKAALVYSNQTIIFKSSTVFSKPLAALEKGRLCLILKCNDNWCKIKTDKYSGWAKKENLWGNF